MSNETVLSKSDTYNTLWEVQEHGWRGVVMSMSNTTQLTAFVKYSGAPYWRIWAGCLFNTLEEAQKWCKDEIAHQQHHAPEPEAAKKPWEAEPEPWRWLWETLSTKIGETEALELRAGLAERISKHESQTQKLS